MQTTGVWKTRAKILTLTFASFLVLPAAAQDTQDLVDRLNRMERDLNALQAQVYRGQGGKPANPGAAAPAPSGNVYGMLDDRISKLEDQLQQTTGDLEKYQYDLNQLKTKLDRMQQDDDFRFKQLEDKQNGAAAAAPAAAPGASPAPGIGVEGNKQGPGSPPGFLGQPHAGAGDKPAAAPPAAADAGALPAGKSAAEQYDYAFGLLRNSDYDNSTKAFQAFLQQHPQDPLAGNAAYWLGQIAYAQGHYDQSAVIFLDAYQKYPKSAKAPESLLKVGLSMGNLGKKKEACAALHRFQTEYPDASDSLRKQASAERQKQGC
jgi:tol-pal system protein YbgF